MSTGRHALLIIASFLLGSALIVLVLEVVLRLLPTHEGLLPVAVDDENRIYHYQPDRVVNWSRDWNFALTNQVRVNNRGFVNDQDYSDKDSRPLLAVVGDSFVTAAMVPFPKTIGGLLARDVAADHRVYTFSTPGSPLSQYLVYAEYARNRYRPQALVVVVVANDFDESLLKYGKTRLGFHYFDEKADGRLVLERLDFHPSLARQVLRHSALARYLALNLQASELVNQLVRDSTDPTLPRPLFVDGYHHSADQTLIEDGYRIIDEFLRQLPQRAGLVPEKILLVVDGIRLELYDESRSESAERSFFGVMRKRLLRQAAARGHEVIDLQPLMQENYRRTGRRFEFPMDYHWNAAGHELAARAMISSKTYRDFLSGR